MLRHHGSVGVSVTPSLTYMATNRRFTVVLFVVAILIGGAPALHAQNGSHIADPANPPPSRWQQDIDALDSALRAQSLTATEPRSLWIAGQLDAGDPMAQASAFMQARVRAPDEKLFLSALATACLAPVRPLPPACDVTDRLADWATRDVENGVPILLLADRARQRNNATEVVANLEEAALRPRFDDYWNRGALLLWEAVRALPGPGDPAARAELAATYGAAFGSFAVRQMQALCREGTTPPDNVRSACHAAGNAVAERAATWNLRIAGARLALRTAAGGSALEQAQQQLSAVQRRAFECAAWADSLPAAFESSDPAVRSRAVSEWESHLAREARYGEVAACAARGNG
jgi:hypothetical protein